MHTSQNKLHPSIKGQLRKSFFQLICDLTNTKEVETFFSDFFTDSEMEVFVKRLAIAYWLKKGRSYTNIMQNLKVSSATVASVSLLANKNGFKLGIKKMEAEEWASQWADRIKKIS